ncbi:MAG: hypothetical protein WCO68_09885 [Verrucomicrobiota bacterium]
MLGIEKVIIHQGVAFVVASVLSREAFGSHQGFLMPFSGAKSEVDDFRIS